MKSANKPLAVSIGEPAGIGPDVVLAAWCNHRAGTSEPLPDFVLYGDPRHLAERADYLKLDVPLSHISSDQIATADIRALSRDSLPVLRLNNSMHAAPGIPVKADAAGVVEAISTAIDHIADGHVSGLVTLPINKKSLYDAGFDYPGHTEFLGHLAEQWRGEPISRPVMMLSGPELRTVPITIHIPLKDVPLHLTKQLIVETALITAHDLRTRFDIAAPRLAFAGLNPHAGESGSLGLEDLEVIEPAIGELRAEGVDCIGPLPADTMFHPAARARYDVAMCMYHDQALIPAKALSFDESVNVTLGLPFIRTSPDHGTAFDIAGKGIANPSSFVAALRMADQMTKTSKQAHP